VATTQKYHSSNQVSLYGFVVQSSAVTNEVSASDVSPAASSQKYTTSEFGVPTYSCSIASANNTLTSVSRGCSPHKEKE